MVDIDRIFEIVGMCTIAILLINGVGYLLFHMTQKRWE